VKNAFIAGKSFFLNVSFICARAPLRGLNRQEAASPNTFG